MFKMKHLALTTVAACALTATVAAHASTFTTLYSFTGGSDGAQAFGTPDLRYNLLRGTAAAGGANGDGVIFNVDPNTGAETIGHAFAGGADGSYPEGALVLVKKVEYGVTGSGGANGGGTLFSFNPKTNAYTQLHGFGASGDGNFPVGGVVYYDGAIYGETAGGGTGYGTIYKYDLTTGTESVVYNFAGGNDGAYPQSVPIVVKGILYGVTSHGGPNNGGTVYTFNPATVQENVLHAFGSSGDGYNPVAAVIYLNGLLYGNTQQGGSAGGGIVYTVDAKTGAEAIIYNFTGNADGSVPVGNFARIGGKLYGSAEYGGTNGYGTVFSIDLATNAFNTIYAFTNGADGAYPWAGMFARGTTLFGTTIGSNSGSSFGSVYKLVP